MRAPIHIDHPPGVRARNVQNKNALELWRFHDLKAWRVEERGSRRGLATNEWRIQIRPGGSVVIQRSCPRLERNGASPRQHAEDGTCLPITHVIGRRPHVITTVVLP